MADKIQKLSRQYLRMCPSKDISWKHTLDCLSSLNYEDSMNYQQQLLCSTVHHPHAIKYPPTATYSRLFLKSLIIQIEDHNREVCEDLYAVYTELLSQDSLSTSDDKCHCYKTYYLAGDLTITLRESLNIISGGTTGMHTWEASHVLADWCDKESARFCGKNILELGAGLGLTGLSVIKSCNPASYTFTDLHATVLETLKENILINLDYENSLILNHSNEGSTVVMDDLVEDFRIEYNDTIVFAKRLDWATDSCDVPSDVILAADVVYDTEIIPPLVNILKEALSMKIGATAYVASTVRNPETLSFFRSALDTKDVKLCSESHHIYQESPSQPESSVIIMHLSL